jgi:hypothetical protein
MLNDVINVFSILICLVEQAIRSYSIRFFHMLCLLMLIVNWI